MSQKWEAFLFCLTWLKMTHNAIEEDPYYK
jgi:hypothetical protein